MLSRLLEVENKQNGLYVNQKLCQNNDEIAEAVLKSLSAWTLTKEQAIELISSKKSITKERKLVIDKIFEKKQPFTVKSIHKECHKALCISDSTVRKIIALFKEMKLLKIAYIDIKGNNKQQYFEVV